MLVWVSIATDPNSAVTAPSTARTFKADGASASTGLMRTIRKPPALMIPACMRADTGVGVSSTSGSQLWKGNWADLRSAPSTSRKAIKGTVGPP